MKTLFNVLKTPLLVWFTTMVCGFVLLVIFLLTGEKQVEVFDGEGAFRAKDLLTVFYPSTYFEFYQSISNGN